MDSAIFFLAMAFLLGLRHSLDPDHIAAVTTFVSRNPGSREGVRTGLKWGVGHGATLLVLGSAVILLGIRFDGGFEVVADRLVGAAIIALAAWRLWAAYRGDYHLHIHRHGEEDVEHAHAHSHADSTGHSHRHAATAMGVLHGMAGTVGVFLLLPVSVTTPMELAYSYLVLFIVGAALSMGAWGMAAGGMYARLSARRAGTVFTSVVVVTSVISAAVGALLFTGAF